MRMTAIYARVSSEQQREENTIASQTASLIDFAKAHDLEVLKEWVFEDAGYSGATLEQTVSGVQLSSLVHFGRSSHLS